MTKNKLKLLYLVTQGHWGGAQKYVFDLATALADEFDITVAVGEPNNMPDLQKKLLGNPKIKLIQLNFLSRSISPIKDFLALLEIKSLYKRTKPDIIHLNSTKAGVLGSLATITIPNSKFKIPNSIIYTVHGWVFNEPMSNLKKSLYKLLEKISARRKDKIIVLSEEEKTIGTKLLKIKASKLEIIPVGIESSDNILDRSTAIKNLNSILKKDILKESDYIIGTIANFYPTKNLDNLIETINITRDKLDNFHSILIGDGNERKNIEFLIKKYNLENNVHLTGFVDNAQKILKAFDVFVLPSKKEGLPYTLLEAKVNNIPIIATEVGSVSKIIEDKKTGLLVEPENTNKLAETLIYAYTHQTEMQKMAENGKNETNAKNLQKEMVRKTIQLYKQSTLTDY